jgi:hypothetical protein
LTSIRYDADDDGVMEADARNAGDDAWVAHGDDEDSVDHGADERTAEQEEEEESEERERCAPFVKELDDDSVADAIIVDEERVVDARAQAVNTFRAPRI